MTKEQFILELMDKLSPLPIEAFEESISFYNEMIDDRMEEGMSEEDAVKDIGDIDDIVTQILSNTPIVTLVKQKIKPKKRINTGTLILLILGSPIWFSLLVAALAVIFSLYVSLWAVVVSFWAAFVSFVACAFAGILLGIGLITVGKGVPGGIFISGAIILAGLSIFLFIGCKAVTKGCALLGKTIILSIKKCFIKKEGTR